MINKSKAAQLICEKYSVFKIPSTSGCFICERSLNKVHSTERKFGSSLAQRFEFKLCLFSPVVKKGISNMKII